MAIKSKLVDIDLKGDLNLSQNKYDTMSVGDSGYLNNTGNLYGGILSPVYRQTMDKDNIHYTDDYEFWLSGNILRKAAREGSDVTSVMEFSSSFSQQELDYKNIDSLYYDSLNDKYSYVKIEPDHLVINNHNKTFDFFDVDMVQPLKTSINENFITILFIDSNNEFKVLFCKNTNTLDQVEVFNTGFTEIRSPIITEYKTGNRVVVSVYSDSGSSTQVLSVKTYIYNTEDNTVSLCTFTPLTGRTQTISTSVPYTQVVEGGMTSSYSSDKSLNKENNYRSYTQNISLTVQSLLGNTALGTTATMYYYVPNVQYPSLTSVPSTIDVNSLTFDNNTFSDTSMRSFKNISDTMYGSVLNYSSSPDLSQTFALTDTSMSSTTALAVKAYKMMECNVGETLSFSTTFNVLQSYYNYGGRYTTTGTVSPFLTKDSFFSRAWGVLLLKVQNTVETNWYKLVLGTDGTLNSIYPINSTTTTTLTKNFTVTEETTFTETPETICNGILENGTLICTDPPTMETTDGVAHFKNGLYCFTGEITEITDTEIKYTCNFNSSAYMGEDTDLVSYPYTMVKQVVSLSKYWFRNCIFWQGNGSIDVHSILYDSGFNKVFIDPGYDADTWQNKQGSEGKLYNWRLLYNNNLLSNVSWGTDTQVGTIIEDWNIIDDVLFIDENNIIYTDGNKVLKVSITDFNGEYTVLGNRYIVFNTTDYLNTWDIKQDMAIHWASDWNNRFFNGQEVIDFLSPTEDNNKIMSDTRLGVIETISAQNANYEITGDPVTSRLMSPNIYSTVYYDKYYLLDAIDNKGIDFYFTFSETTPSYYSTYKNGVWYGNPVLLDAFYVTVEYYNPNIFSKFIETYNLNDMVINKGKSTAYPLNKYNGGMSYNYDMTTGLENAEDVFVVQTLYYMVSNGKIFEIVYEGETMKNFSVTANISHMKYVGCLPTEAIFWDYVSRSFWSFSGDAILRKIFQSNEIGQIKGTWYNPATQELFVATDIGLLNINNTQNYLLRDYTDVTKMWFFDDYFIVKNTLEDNTYDIKIAYEPTLIDNPDDTEMKVETKWFGAPENSKVQIDCIYFRLMKPVSYTGSTFFNVKATTMTDYSFETDTKNTANPTVDTDTNSVYIRYQPKYQKCVSMKLSIRTNLPIISWSIGFTPLEEVGAISTVNI